MKIKLLKGVAGIDFTYSAGSVQDLPATLALSLINGNLAVEIKEEEKPIQPIHEPKPKISAKKRGRK